MRRLLMGIVVVGIVLSAGVGSAQSDGPPAMPEKVRKALEYRIGTWNYVIEGEDIQAEMVYRGAPGKTCISGDIHGTAEGTPFFSTHIVGWDGESENGTRMNMVSDVENWSDHSRILSPTTEEGPFSGYMFGKEYSGKQCLVKQDQDHMTLNITDRKHGNESLSDWKILFTRATPTTREDFDEFCALFKGRWVCEMKLLKDRPGLGSQGDTFTAYFHNTLSESGHYITSEAHYGDHWQSQLKYYDPVPQAIKTTVADSTGATWFATDRKVPGGWRTRIIEIGVDGTKEGEWILNHTFSKDGKTWTVKVTTAADESTILATNVWRRMSK
jgi:hypothetical protein